MFTPNLQLECSMFNSSLHLLVKGNAKIEGLVKDLHMTSGQYSACLSIFFVSYVSWHACKIFHFSE